MAIRGVVFIVSVVAYGIVIGGMSSGEWLSGAWLGGLFIAIGRCLSFLENRPPRRSHFPACAANAPRRGVAAAFLQGTKVRMGT